MLLESLLCVALKLCSHMPASRIVFHLCRSLQNEYATPLARCDKLEFISAIWPEFRKSFNASMLLGVVSGMV